jgi:hypothetical protein
MKNEIVAPVQRMSGKMVITSGFGVRTRNGKKENHNAVDLRSIRFLSGKGYVPQWCKQKIVATENCEVIESGRDKYGNGYITVRPIVSTWLTQIRYVHVKLIQDFPKSTFLIAGEHLGYTEIAGNSFAHHLHFSTLTNLRGYTNPLDYFINSGIKYKFKQGII